MSRSGRTRCTTGSSSRRCQGHAAPARCCRWTWARILDGTELGAPLVDRDNESADRSGGMLDAQAEYDALLDAVAPGAGVREGF